MMSAITNVCSALPDTDTSSVGDLAIVIYKADATIEQHPQASNVHDLSRGAAPSSPEVRRKVVGRRPCLAVIITNTTVRELCWIGVGLSQFDTACRSPGVLLSQRTSARCHHVVNDILERPGGIDERGAEALVVLR